MNPLPGLSALALFGALGCAQSPISTVPVTASSSMRLGHGLRADGDGLLGCGNDYVVRFDTSGAHFTPVLGADAPAVAPLRLALQAIHRGGTVLPCDLQDAPAQAGDTAVYDRSPSIRERYELRDDGMEQSFVFDALPGRGELVVRCRLGGLGKFAAPAADGGLDFVRAGQRLAQMGTVTGIDANGARAQGAIRHEGDFVELSLPAWFVDQAKMPLVLDPFVSTAQGISVVTANDSAPHTVWHAQLQRWLCVFERAVSSTQKDVMIRPLAPNGSLGSLLPVASVAGSFSRAPRIAYHTGSNRCLVVYQQGESEFALNTIQGAVIDGLATTITPFQVASDPLNSCTFPDLSGDPTGAGQGVVAYELRGNGLRLVPYTMPATGLPTLGAVVTLSAHPTSVRPRVAKSATSTLAITYGQKPGNFYFAYLRAVSRTGALLGSLAAIGNPGGPALLHPDIDGDGTSFMMVLEYEVSATDRDVSVAQWQWNGAGWGMPVASAAVSQLLGTDERYPTVALLGPKYAIAWEQTTGFLTSIVQCRNFSRTGCITCGAQVTVPLAGSMAQPALASTHASGGTDNMASLAITAAPQLFPPSGDVYACQWNAFTPVTPTVLSAGCGHPMTLSLVGAPGIGNTTFGFSVSTTDAQASLGAFLLGIGLSTPQLPCGTCLIVNPVATNLVVLSGGVANQGLSLPCDQTLIGFPIQAQAATIGSVQNVCPSLNTLSVSRAIAFSIAE
ncbi:MAG: hypothetical protein JNK49_13910 [Planctomycetes bacterium]|nr:hypothetical protein [Planctomycetota bacterium]